MGPSISESQLATVMSYVKIGSDEGATLACGGHRLSGGAHSKGFGDIHRFSEDIDIRIEPFDGLQVDTNPKSREAPTRRLETTIFRQAV